MKELAQKDKEESEAMMKKGYPYVTDICVCVLMANLVAYGCWYGVNPYDSPPPLWPQYLLGWFEALGAIPIAICYYIGSSERSNPFGDLGGWLCTAHQM